MVRSTQNNRRRFIHDHSHSYDVLTGIRYWKSCEFERLGSMPDALYDRAVIIQIEGASSRLQVVILNDTDGHFAFERSNV